MYTLNELKELFDIDGQIVEAALSLYFERNGGINQEPYSEEVADLLDQYFSLVSSKNKLIAAGSQEKIAKVDNQILQILGSQGVALSSATLSARQGVALADFQLEIFEKAYQARLSEGEIAFLSKQKEEVEWLEELSVNHDKQGEILKKLGITPREEEYFQLLIEKSFKEAQQKAFAPREKKSRPNWNWEEML
jgi:hypothetical protein